MQRIELNTHLFVVGQPYVIQFDHLMFSTRPIIRQNVNAEYFLSIH